MLSLNHLLHKLGKIRRTLLRRLEIKCKNNQIFFFWAIKLNLRCSLAEVLFCIFSKIAFNSKKLVIKVSFTLLGQSKMIWAPHVVQQVSDSRLVVITMYPCGSCSLLTLQTDLVTWGVSFNHVIWISPFTKWMGPPHQKKKKKKFALRSLTKTFKKSDP